MLRASLLLALALAWTSPASAQEAAPHDFYKPDDPLRDTKLRIEEAMGTYALHYPQRDTEEIVEINRKTITVKVWVSIGAQSENALGCKALRWLLLGRHQWAQGARGVFSAFPDLDTLALQFIDVRVNREGEAGKKFVQPYLNLSVRRNFFDELDLASLEEAFANDECQAFIRKAGLSYDFDKKYYNRYTQEK
jgi:hypothetical protein